MANDTYGIPGALEAGSATVSGTLSEKGKSALQSVSQKPLAASIVGGVLTLDLSYNEFVVNATANITSVVFTNWPSTTDVVYIVIEFVNNGTLFTVNWGAAFHWSNGVPPPLTGTNGRRDIFVLRTHDGGSTIYGGLFGANM